MATWGLINFGYERHSQVVEFKVVWAVDFYGSLGPMMAKRFSSVSSVVWP